RSSCVPGRNDHGYLAADQIDGEWRQPVILALRPAVFDIDITVLHIACFIQPLQERGEITLELGCGLAAEIPNYRHRRLGLCRERPRCRRAEEGDEVASSDHG